MPNILDGLDEAFDIPEPWYIIEYTYIPAGYYKENDPEYYEIKLRKDEKDGGGYTLSAGYGRTLANAVADWFNYTGRKYIKND